MNSIVSSDPRHDVEEWQARLGAQVRTARIDAGLDQARLAELSGVSTAGISKLENGRGSHLESLIRVVRALGRTDWLEALAPEPTISPLRMADSGGRARRRVRAPRAPDGR